MRLIYIVVAGLKRRQELKHVASSAFGAGRVSRTPRPCGRGKRREHPQRGNAQNEGTLQPRERPKLGRRSLIMHVASSVFGAGHERRSLILSVPSD